MRTFHAIFTRLLQFSKLREILERIWFNGGNLITVKISTDHMRGWDDVERGRIVIGIDETMYCQ